MTARRVRIGHEDTCLTLSDQHDRASTRSSKGELWSVHVFLDVPHLQAETQVWLTDIDSSLAAFIAELAEEWRGWNNVREWATYEGGLALACQHDGLGHVQVSVDLREHSGGLGWRVQADVEVDAGQVNGLAEELAAFVG